MAANLPLEYYKLEDEYTAAKSKQEKIRILEEMLSVIPQHKASQKVRGEIRRKISLLKKEIDVEARKKKGAGKKGIRKEGAAQVVMLGLPNSGKSFILNKLCNKNIASTELPFETKNPEVGMMDYKGVLIQLVEIPSLMPNFYEKQGESKGIIFTADALCFVIKSEKDLELIKKEIDISNKPIVILKSSESHIPEKIWNSLKLIKIYTKTPGKAPEKRPVSLKKGATVKDVADEIHRDFIDKFKYAKVIRNKSRIKERQVGLKFVLEDEDIVEFHTR